MLCRWNNVVVVPVLLLLLWTSEEPSRCVYVVLPKVVCLTVVCCGVQLLCSL